MTRPFRMRYGADLHNNRGINCDPPINDSDVANKIWTEEQIAAQSRLRGVFYPDFDGQQTPDPDLNQFTPNVDIFTADYWITALSGRAGAGPTALQELSADDRVVANVSTGGDLDLAWRVQRFNDFLIIYATAPVNSQIKGRIRAVTE